MAVRRRRGQSPSPPPLTRELTEHTRGRHKDGGISVFDLAAQPDPASGENAPQPSSTPRTTPIMQFDAHRGTSFLLLNHRGLVIRHGF